MKIVVEGRNCDGCTLCCKIVGISELEKPAGTWCPHCDARRGCRIYEQRPGECRGFYCGYLTNPALDERWKPSRCKIVLAYDELKAARLMVFVDPVRPDVWREEPYYSQIKGWARAAIKARGQVIVWQGANATVVLPDGEKNLGALAPGHLIYISQKMGPQGYRFDAEAVAPDDPRVSGRPSSVQDAAPP
ncbi:MAG TPA: hypothetical protein VJ740_16545 [Hyphomicrobiaceae bacterium]|jgi:hypothetical protein|nr:hypothetical protein [Hyphomicrobiaceae bacterium]